jgi:exosome complex RNA-binding protein Rrp4
MKKMLTTILTRLFGNELGRKTDEMKPGLQGVEVIMQPVEPKRTRYDDPDLNILAEKYGELQPGKVITIELNECAQLLNRKRVRLDAFKTLQNRLKNDYGVELKIYSRRTKV